MKFMNPKNSVQLIGFLGADPEIKTFPATAGSKSGEGKLARLRIATNEGYRNTAGEWTDKTEWHNISCWDGLADTAERLLQKGSEVLVTGRLHYNTYTAKDGTTRTAAEIEAVNLLVLDKARAAAPAAPAMAGA